MPEYGKEMKDKDKETGEEKRKNLAAQMRDKSEAYHAVICIYIKYRVLEGPTLFVYSSSASFDEC